jgi:hydroxymethylbilane synthase
LAEVSRLVIGSRGSRLALIQAEEVIDQLETAAPQLELSLVKIKTQGDIDRKSSLSEIGGRGIFVKELEEALLRCEIDVAVHSLKDMPSELDPQLQIAAVPRRRDPRDALISRSGETIDRLPVGSRIGTGSQRRALQLQAYRRDLEICSVRGNVDTRVRKVRSGEMDGVVLAAAALERMGWQDRAAEYLPVEAFLPAACQGALGVEVRAGDGATGVLELLNDDLSRKAVAAERAFLRALGGGCRSAVAALASIEGGGLHMDAMVGGLISGKIIRVQLEGSPQDPEALGGLVADRILEMGGMDLIEEVQGPTTW